MRSLILSFLSSRYIGRAFDQVKLGTRGSLDIIHQLHSNRLLKEQNQLWIIRSLKESSSKPFFPSPTGQLCSGMTFGMSFFFKETRICPETLRRSLINLADELPILTGRIKNGPENGLGKSKISGAFIMCNNEGFQMSVSSTGSSVRDIQMQSVRSNHCSPCHSFPCPDYLRTTIDPSLMIRGKANIFQVEILQCSDGDVLSASFAHILADGKRAFEVLLRLSEMYLTVSEGRIPTGRSLRYDAWFVDSRCKPEKPAPAKTQTLSLWDILSAPKALFKYFTDEYEIVNLFISKRLVETIRSASCSLEHSRYHLTTLDIVQALISTLLLDIRKGRTVLQELDIATINIELTGLLQRASKDEDKQYSYLGNGSHIMEVEIDSDGTSGCVFAECREATSSVESKYFAAIRYNASLIRRSIQRFRTDSTKLTSAIHAHANMSQMNPSLLKALFLVKGHRQKVSSTTAIASFPIHQVCIYRTIVHREKIPKIIYSTYIIRLCYTCFSFRYSSMVEAQSPISSLPIPDLTGGQ